MITSIFDREKEIQARIKKAFESSAIPDEMAFDISFHMTDWFGDIRKMQKQFANFDELSDDEITGFIIAFLAHVPNHLNAAKKLVGLGPVEDIFKLGIFEDDE